MTIDHLERRRTPALEEPELVLIVQVSDTGAVSPGDLAALADALRETTSHLLPGARTHTVLSPGPAPLVVDLPARELVLDSTRVELSHTEFEIFSHLVSRPRAVVPRSTLRALGTGYIDPERGNRSVDVHVSRIRSKLGRFGDTITTVRGTGYRFDPDPRVQVVETLDRRSA